MRTAHAGIILAKILAQVGKNPIEPKIETPDQHVVLITYDDHPQAQCRLDTYYQAAICGISANLDLDEWNYHVNSSTGPKHHEGLRPTCWFQREASHSPNQLGSNH